ncbi:MAG: hypothetical protein ACTSX7_08250 [Alphaproteobacteria bacterium]
MPKMRKKKAKTVRDPIDEIADQAKELLDRVLELRSLAPTLSEAKALVAQTESRMRVLQQELNDVMNGLLPNMPSVETVEPGPQPIVMASDEPTVTGEPGSISELPEDSDDIPSADGYNQPLRDRTDLSTKTIASCNRAGMMTVGKVVEWYASGTPFGAINGIGPAEDKELRALVAPYRHMLPKIRYKLGM